MRSLPRPGITGAEALELCASSIRDEDLRNRLLLAVASVEAAEAVYVENGEGATLHALAGTKNVGGYVTGKEVERVYNGTFVKSSRTRNVYAKLKKACVNDICPLCGQGTVHQLDHYLPITSFPVFGVTAINLVPACSDCNKYKLVHVPATAAEQTIHPYFDEVDDERWLFGEVVEGTPAAVRFSVIPPVSWGAVKAERMRTHFRIYRLGTLYATHAAVEIVNMRYALRKMAATAGFEQRIRKDLRGRAESCADVYENSWQRATYDALADSDWFCAGGFDET
ncbi:MULTISPECIES: hypothetical protein [unclassified Pseudomonas]|uniref:hypothetical protein n=1 Tax=unclassified Pseudomonas TaxID=196821 RepID=UPI0024571E39|nr:MULTISPECIES: hypothetical protein [unclassified Pseudomonas]MDH4564532.1 hypothetical protein [Pseudomonas sp. BN411]MDH4655321.1 hypothetical protein [Pseudomonas sp. BN606]